MPPRVPDGTIRRHPAGYLLEKHGSSFVLQHRLVWNRAYGPIPKGYVIHHINHDRLDNRLENLELCTRSAHLAEVHGRDKTGPHAPKSAEHRAKISAANKGKPKSAEHRRKLSEAAKRRPRTPDGHLWI